MSSQKKANKPLTDLEKQHQPVPGEIDPKNAKVKVFLAMLKAKRRFSLSK
ncbi:hypothetical protein R50072_34560 [Simiduia litorea]